MPTPLPVPPALLAGPFTTADARAVGISPTVLRRRATRLHHGVWCFGEVPTDPAVVVTAARLVVPAAAALSHTSALEAYGIRLGAPGLHFSVRGTHQSRRGSITVHRRRTEIETVSLPGFGPVTTPARTFVDAATALGLRDLVRAGDFLVRHHLTLEQLLVFVAASRLDGVVRARRAAALVRERVDSVTETDLRLLLRFARIPEPECNTPILDETGRFLARGDLPFRRYRVLVEYDGWHHERDARQRQKDHLRRERLEAAGWIVIVVTAADMHDPLGVVRRVHAALVRRGHRGPAPVMSETWQRWFAHDPHDA